MIIANMPFVVVSILLFIGRLYDLLNFTDLNTGYLTNAVISKPLIIALIFLVAFCCTVFVYPIITKPDKKIVHTPGIFGAFAGAFLIATAIFNIIYIFKWGGFLGFDIALILGSISLILFSFIDIKGKQHESIPFVLMVLGFISVCLDAVIVNFSTPNDTIYLFKNISFIVTAIFVLLLFKSVYAQTKYTNASLYFVSLLNFAFSGLCMLALLIVYAVKIGFEPRVVFLCIGYISMGLYSLSVAFKLTKKSQKQSINDTLDIDTDTAVIDNNYTREHNSNLDITGLFSPKESPDLIIESKSSSIKSKIDTKSTITNTETKRKDKLVNNGKKVFTADGYATKKNATKKVVFKVDD